MIPLEGIAIFFGSRVQIPPPAFFSQLDQVRSTNYRYIGIYRGLYKFLTNLAKLVILVKRIIYYFFIAIHQIVPLHYPESCSAVA